MRRRPPPEVDPERLRSLLASARPEPEPVGPSGWVPEEAPHADSSFDPGWLDEPSADDGVGAAPGEVAEKDVGSGGRHRPPPRVLTVPVALRGARVAVSVRAVVAFLLLLVVAVVFFAVRVARAEQAAAPQSVPAGEGLVARSSVPVGVRAPGARSATALGDRPGRRPAGRRTASSSSTSSGRSPAREWFAWWTARGSSTS